MPTVRKLTQEEVQTVEYKGKGQRKLTEEQYDAFLADYAVGDYGEADLEPDEKRLTVRNRFKAAAARRGVGLDFKRTTGTVLRFRVVPQAEATQADGRVQAAKDLASRKASSQPAPTGRGRGRRKRQAA